MKNPILILLNTKKDQSNSKRYQKILSKVGFSIISPQNDIMTQTKMLLKFTTRSTALLEARMKAKNWPQRNTLRNTTTARAN